MIHAPGRFMNGRVGPWGTGPGHGLFPEPDPDPEFDFLDEMPTEDEITFFRNRRQSFYTETATNVDEDESGYYCDGQTGLVHKLIVFHHDVTFDRGEGQPPVTYQHYAAIRYPGLNAVEVADPSNPYPDPHDFPIIVQCHGASDRDEAIPMRTADTMIENLGGSDFLTRECLFLIPMYFGWSFETVANDGTCMAVFDQYPDWEIPIQMVDQDWPAIPDPLAVFDYGPLYTEHDAFVRCILESLAAVRQMGHSTSKKVAFLGTSLGCGMATQSCGLLNGTAQESPQTKAVVGFFGPTDQYANFMKMNYKRYRASRILNPIERWHFEDPTKWYQYTYKDILPNMIRRCRTPAVEEYINETDPVLKAEKRAGLRYAFLNGCPAEWWKYDTGPWPTMILHGTADDTVLVDNSRWFAEQMRLHNIPPDDTGFQYLETFDGGHRVKDVDEDHLGQKLEFREMAAQLLEDALS
ncbi:hypothetical protein KQI52_05945 [bacterium]|nr:hypothetical protein [bacterium]